MKLSPEQLQNDIVRSVKIALEEDVGSGDITAALIPENKVDQAYIITREQCVLCGQAWLEETYRQLGGLDTIEWHVKDGELVDANTKLVTLKGNSRRLLTGERTALNFIQLLSSTATKAHRYKLALGESSITLLDTRKTIPGLRTAQKYAVATGGCHNHRIGLYDAYLIKENHIAACGSIKQAVTTAKKLHPDKTVEMEVENIEELKQALAAGADIIMLDNFSSEQLASLADIDKGSSRYELSGNLTLDDIKSISDNYIDYISFGALTKHVVAIDLSFRII